MKKIVLEQTKYLETTILVDETNEIIKQLIVDNGSLKKAIENNLEYIDDLNRFSLYEQGVKVLDCNACYDSFAIVEE